MKLKPLFNLMLIIWILSVGTCMVYYGISSGGIPKQVGEATIDIGGKVNWEYPIIICSYCKKESELSDYVFVLEGEKEKRIICMDCLIRAFDKILNKKPKEDL